MESMRAGDRRSWIGPWAVVAWLVASSAVASPQGERPEWLDPPRRDPDSTGTQITPPAEVTVPTWRQMAAWGAHASLYAGATKVGSRFGLERRFEVVRLESAYVYDLVAHVWAVQQLGGLMANVHEWGGMERSRAERMGAWGAAFGSLTYMEFINGFMPGVRFDPLDPVANAAGAAMVTEGPALVRRYPWLRRLSFEFGYKDWGRVFGPEKSSGFAGNVWHDYPNGRFALGWGIGPLESEWARLFVSYQITSFELEELQNQVGLGIELKPHGWIAPWLERLPGGRSVLDFVNWWDRRLLLPGLYVQLATFDLGRFSDREPFHE